MLIKILQREKLIKTLEKRNKDLERKNEFLKNVLKSFMMNHLENIDSLKLYNDELLRRIKDLEKENVPVTGTKNK